MKIYDDQGREVVATKTQNKLPIGTVLMFNGAGWVDNGTISGWWKCDGDNGTPNLVDKFIRSEASSGNTGGADTNTHRHDFRIALFDFGYKAAGGGAGLGNAGAYRYSTTSYAGAGGTDGSETSTVAVSASTASNLHSRYYSVGDTDVGSANDNKPTYYSLIFVMRVE